MATATISRQGKDGRLVSRRIDGVLIIGRNEPADMFNKDEPAENGLQIMSVSTKQLQLEFDHASSILTVTNIGRAKSAVRRGSDNTVEILAKDQPTSLRSGDRIYMISKGTDKLAFAADIDVRPAAAPPPEPAPPPKINPAPAPVPPPAPAPRR